MQIFFFLFGIVVDKDRVLHDQLWTLGNTTWNIYIK